MRVVFAAWAALGLAVATGACSDNTTEATASNDDASIAGDWMVDVGNTHFDETTQEFSLAGGTYACPTCPTPIEVPADGAWHEIAGSNGMSTKVEVSGESSVTTSMRRGEEDVGATTWTVSGDGQTMEASWTTIRGDQKNEGTTSYKRAAAGPVGAHPISGKWITSGVGEVNDEALQFSFRIDGDTVTNKRNVVGYTAQIGGDAVEVEGLDDGTMVKVEPYANGGVRETYMLNGETTVINELVLNGDSLIGTTIDPRSGSRVEWVAKRR